jgi:hypothetical protein
LQSDSLSTGRRAGSGIIPEIFGKKSIVTPGRFALGGLDPHIDNVSHPTGENQNSRGYGSETDECPVSVGRIDIDMAVFW